MNVYDKMINFRTSRGLTVKHMAQRTGVPAAVLSIVEGGSVTHPTFVRRIKAGYNLSEEEAEALLPKNRRKSDPEYDPDRYVIFQDSFTERTLPPQSVIERYVTEKHSEQIAKDGKRRMA